MSKAAKQSIFILVFLLLVSLGFTGYTLLQQKKLEEEKISVENELGKSQENEKKQAAAIGQLQDDVKKAEDEKANLERKLKLAQADAQDLSTKLQKLTSDVDATIKDRDKWKQRIDTLTKERDDFKEKLAKQPEKVVYKEREPVEAIAPAEEFLSEDSETLPSETSSSNVPGVNKEEDHWASVLRDKASLEVKLNSLKDELSQKSYEVAELKQVNGELQLQLDNVKHDQEELDREIEYKTSLINNLSLELARTKNDKKFMADHLKELNGENTQLRQDIQRLVSAKSALEKSVVRIAQDKEKVTKQLLETDGLIQSKINEIWDIKDSIDQGVKSKSKRASISSPGDVELPPIIVNGAGIAAAIASAPAEANSKSDTPKPGFDGKVVSMNAENNFVIVNIGETAGLRLGDALSIYRDSKYIARLEVIQVRKDIAAADIKEQWSKIKVGDIVR